MTDPLALARQRYEEAKKRERHTLGPGSYAGYTERLAARRATDTALVAWAILWASQHGRLVRMASDGFPKSIAEATRMALAALTAQESETTT